MRKNSFGVADDFLLSYSLNKINEKAPTSSPFFATILTVSNHPPYIVPEKFENVSTKPEFQIVAFADDAIRQFFADAEKQSWFKNTIFVLLGDHGKIGGQCIGRQSTALLQQLENGRTRLVGHFPKFEEQATAWQAGQHQPDGLSALTCAHDELVHAGGLDWDFAAPFDTDNAPVDLENWMGRTLE